METLINRFFSQIRYPVKLRLKGSIFIWHYKLELIWKHCQSLTKICWPINLSGLDSETIVTTGHQVRGSYLVAIQDKRI